MTDEQRVFENVAEMLLNGKPDMEVKERGRLNRFQLVVFLRDELDRGIDLFPRVKKLKDDII